ncbi:MAG TPA: LptA/OstA family protein [Opitutales bacterium]|nr:LptA/OstA family protein [Opitutales bacterium]
MTLSNQILSVFGLLFFSTLLAAAPADSPTSEETDPAPAEESASSEAVAVDELPADENSPTVIESDHLKMTTLDDETQFIFSENVSITTTDMTVYCDRLEVFAGRLDVNEKAAREKADSEKSKNEDPIEEELGRIQRIYAIGNVRVVQGDREATSGRAEVFPREGRVVLTENPVLRNEDGRVSGARITFLQGEGEAIVESDLKQRPRVELPSVPPLGSGDPFRNSDAERN